MIVCALLSLPAFPGANKSVCNCFKKSMVRSAPIPIRWPPEHANSTLAQPIQWDYSEPQADSFPFAILLIPPRPSSGLPGEASIAVLNGLLVWVPVPTHTN